MAEDALQKRGLAERTVEEDEGKSLEEIIMTSVHDNPEAYNPPKPDFKVIEE